MDFVFLTWRTQSQFSDDFMSIFFVPKCTKSIRVIIVITLMKIRIIFRCNNPSFFIVMALDLIWTARLKRNWCLKIFAEICMRVSLCGAQCCKITPKVSFYKKCASFTIFKLTYFEFWPKMALAWKIYYGATFAYF